MKVSFFLPIRTGSQRVKNKNLRPFARFKRGILELKIRQLLECEGIDEILLSTNDNEAIDLAHSLDDGTKIKVDRRPQELCLDSTPLKALIEYVPTVVNYEHVVWGHATTPLAEVDTYDRVVKKYKTVIQNGYDSLVSGVELKNFIIDKRSGQFITEQKSEGSWWPRTQDLPSLFEVNHVVFITHKDSYINNGNRIGKKPYYYEMSKLESVDIDWEEDFKIAEALYDRFGRL